MGTRRGTTMDSSLTDPGHEREDQASICRGDFREQERRFWRPWQKVVSVYRLNISHMMKICADCRYLGGQGRPGGVGGLDGLRYKH